jgi:hypothetical protein
MSDRTEPRSVSAVAFVAGAVTVALAAFAFTYSVERAQAASSYFPRTYSADADMAFGYRIASLDTTTAEDSLHTGDDGWDNVPGNWFDWGWAGEFNSVSWTGDVCATAPVNGRHYLVTANEGSVSARTAYCMQSGTSTILRGVTRFDSTESWYVGAYTPPTNKTDLRSIAVHEMGHAAGWGSTHITWPCGSYDYMATMCDTPVAGKTWWRTLQSYDTTQIAAAY